MDSLKQQRFNDVYNKNVSTTEEEDDSDFEMDYASNNNQNLRGAGKYSENKQYQSNLIKRKAGLNLKYSSSDNGKRRCETGRRPKAFNRNALMARENRIKKKMYVQNLEESVDTLKDENKKLSSILDNQSTVISDLRKEVKYLKNVLANSTDISRLLKSINENTGMPVATSINHSMKINARQQQQQQEVVKDFHPWAENKQSNLNSLDDCFNYDDSNGEFSTTLLSSDIEREWNDLFSGLYSPECINKDSKRIDDVFTPTELTEHNYTNSACSPTDTEDSGVCLHISGHKVSLEFCVSCAENASTVWNKD